jgi:hypothetical protein
MLSDREIRNNVTRHPEDVDKKWLSNKFKYNGL